MTEVMRSDASRMIADNPTSITITRVTSALSGGKRSSSTSTVAAQTVRIYGKNVSEVAREGDEARFVRRREVRMLAAYNANVLPHSGMNEDTFTVGGVKYRIKNVRDIAWEGVVVSKQCTLEELQ